MKILAISGSAREASTNTALLNVMKDVASTEVEVVVFHGLSSLPVFSPDLEGVDTPLVVRQFMAMIASSDGIVIASPEYVRAIPGGLKNAIDWMVSRNEIIDKPIALMHASHRGDDMLASLRLVLATVSRNFLESSFLRLPLIGKSPKETEEFLRRPEHTSQVSMFLKNFVASIIKITSEAKG